MEDKIYNSILQKKGLNLTEEENTALNELVDFFDGCIEKHDVTDVDKTVAYQYGNLCEEGIIQNEENKKLAFATFIYYVLEEANGEIDSLIDYPFCYPYIYDGLDSGLLDDYMACHYCPTEEENKYYELAYYWNDAVLRAGIWGFLGGFRLVDSLIRLDAARLMLSYVCMKKDGGHFDLIKAAKCLSSYHRDHLCQKHGATNDVWDSYYTLYSLLEEASDSKVQGINYYLAYMNTFGIGCDINYKKAKEYINKEESLYNECSNIDENDSSVAGTSEYYHMCWDLEEEIINCESETNEIKKVNDKLEIGDIVQYGTYDDRKILWKVIGLEDGRALLLSTQAIESTYIANECPRISNDSKFKIIDFVKSMDIFNECYDNSFSKERIIYDEEHILKVNKKMGPIFLLSEEEIKKYIPNKEDRQCRVRMQAQLNGYDDSGVDVDENGVCAMWATRTEKKDGMKYVGVDSFGDFCDCSKLWATVGIRPAIWVKQ